MLAKQLRDAWIALNPGSTGRTRSASESSEEIPLASSKAAKSRAKKVDSKAPSVAPAKLTKEQKAEEKAREKANSLQTMLAQFKEIVTEESVYLRVVRYEVCLDSGVLSQVLTRVLSLSLTMSWSASQSKRASTEWDGRTT